MKKIEEKNNNYVKNPSKTAIIGNCRRALAA
jgi:hypothetical protein